MIRLRHREALATATATSQVTSLSLLVSMYLQSVYAATAEEIEIFLSPVASRSRVREAVRGLSATRQIHSLSMDAQTYHFLEDGLPAFAEVPGAGSELVCRSFDRCSGPRVCGQKPRAGATKDASDQASGVGSKPGSGTNPGSKIRAHLSPAQTGDQNRTEAGSQAGVQTRIQASRKASRPVNRFKASGSAATSPCGLEESRPPRHGSPDLRRPTLLPPRETVLHGPARGRVPPPAQGLRSGLVAAGPERGGAGAPRTGSRPYSRPAAARSGPRTDSPRPSSGTDAPQSAPRTYARPGGSRPERGGAGAQRTGSRPYSRPAATRSGPRPDSPRPQSGTDAPQQCTTDLRPAWWSTATPQGVAPGLGPTSGRNRSHGHSRAANRLLGHGPPRAPARGDAPFGHAPQAVGRLGVLNLVRR